MTLPLIRSALVAFILLLPFVVWAHGGLWGYLSNLNLASLSLVLVALLHGRKDVSLRDALPFCCLFLHGLALLSASSAENLWQLLFIFFLALNLFCDEESGLRPVFGRVLLLACLFNAIVGVFQYFGQAELGGLLFFSAPPGSINGNLRQSNNLSTLMVVGVALLAGAYEKTEEGSRWRHAFIVMSLLFALVVAMTLSRTGLIAMLAVCAFGFSFMRRKALVLAALMGTLLSNLWLSLPGFSGVSGPSSAVLRMFVETQACAGRRAIWQDGLVMILDKPWTGWGWKSLRHAQLVLGGEGRLKSCAMLGELHNELLQLAAAFGLPVLALILLLLFSGFLSIYRKFSQEKMVYVLVALPLLLHSMLEYPLHYPVFLMILAFSVSGLMVGGNSSKRFSCPAGYLLPTFFLGLVMAFFVGAEMSHRSLAGKNTAQTAATITTAEHFYRPREALLFTLYFSPLDTKTARLLLAYEKILMKSMINLQLLEKLRQAAEVLGDAEKAVRFERMERFETERLARAAGK